MTLRRVWNGIGIIVVLAACFAPAGCEAIRNNKLFARHFSNENQNEAANRRWNNFRGSVRIQMAEQHIRAGRFEEAEKVLSEARELMPKEPKVLKLSAELHVETGELTRARSEIEEYMATVPDDVEGRALGGRIAMQAGRIDDAIMWYRSAIELAPDEAAYRVKLAECLMSRGDSADALSIIQHSSQFEESLPLRQLAMEICDARGDAEGAARHATIVAQLAAGDEQTCERAGIILAHAGAYDDAITVLGPIVRRHVGGRRTHTLDGNDEGEAERPPVEAIQAFAKSCLETNRDEEAKDVLKIAIRNDPTDQVTWSLYCRAAIRSGDLKMALDIVSTFNERNDPIPEMLVLQAYVQFLMGDLSAARKTADRALKIDPGFEPAFLLKAKASNDSRDRKGGDIRRQTPQRAVTSARPATHRKTNDARSEANYGRQWYLNPRVIDPRVAVAEGEIGR